MKTCSLCGSDIDDDGIFCPKCGANSTAAESAPGSEPEQPMSRPEYQSAQGGYRSAQPGQTGYQTGQPNQAGYQSGFQPGYQPGQTGYQPGYQPGVQPPIAPAPPAATDHTAEFDPQEVKRYKVFASLGYLNLIFLLVCMFRFKDSAYVQFHVKQASSIILSQLLVGFFCIFIIPVLVAPLAYFILGVVNIIAVVNCVMGKSKEVPIVSKFGFC